MEEPHRPQPAMAAADRTELPHVSQATERQRRDGMCWSREDEPYNAGRAFKVTCRDHRGVMVTIIADNYYGYCKKEVKTQTDLHARIRVVRAGLDGAVYVLTGSGTETISPDTPLTSKLLKLTPRE